MKKTCRQCSANFEVIKDDLQFYEKMSPVIGGKKHLFPEPTLCPDCRRQQRFAFRNLHSLHHRKCDFSGKQIISSYRDDSPHKVYHADIWWGDQWDGLEYGRDVDFSRPFFEQFAELYLDAPLIHHYVTHSENCEYINGAAHCKNCYLCGDLDYCEDSYYLKDAKRCVDCVDCTAITDCELCYECTDCYNCYGLFFSQRCRACKDSYFLSDCQRCTNCIGCSNLVDKEYYVFNEPCSKEEFEKRKADLYARSTLDLVQQRVHAMTLQTPKKYYFGHSNENFSGNNIQNAKNSYGCYDCFDIENCKHCRYLFQSSNCMDYDIFGEGSQWIYNCQAVGINCTNCAFCMFCWVGVNELYYCTLCNNGSKNCFGCCSLKNKQYCILNKQYSKEKYEQLVPKIIEHMQETGEWGEFFPMSMSPYSYNETLSHEYFPLTKQEVEKRGCSWYEKDEEEAYMGPTVAVPNTVKEVGDDICEKILQCEVSKKPYKIIPQELKFYRNHQLPIPNICPEQRRMQRLALRNPYHLWDRHCDKCNKDIQTTYAPDRPETVYCEECYLQAVS